MRRSVRTPRRFDDRGQVAGIEVLPFGFLIFVVGALLLANAWAVVDAKLAVTAAAREAARTYVESPDAERAARDARAAGTAALAGQGQPADRLDLTIDGEGGFARCAAVTVIARTEVPAVGLPFIGGFGRNFEVRAEHTEIVDPFRSGLPGEADCG